MALAAAASRNYYNYMCGNRYHVTFKYNKAIISHDHEPHHHDPLHTSFLICILSFIRIFAVLVTNQQTAQYTHTHTPHLCLPTTATVLRKCQHTTISTSISISISINFSICINWIEVDVLRFLCVCIATFCCPSHCSWPFAAVTVAFSHFIYTFICARYGAMFVYQAHQLIAK